MKLAGPALFDEVSARLPLFEEISAAALEHLVMAGFGRGLLISYKRGCLRKAGFERARMGWSTKFEMRTPRYTTRIDELLVAYASLRNGLVR